MGIGSRPTIYHRLSACKSLEEIIAADYRQDPLGAGKRPENMPGGFACLQCLGRRSVCCWSWISMDS